VPSRRDFLALAAFLFPFDVANRPSGINLAIIVVKERSEAEAILKRIMAGESFEALAQQFSIVPSARDGGFLGRLQSSALPLVVRNALQGVGPGEVTKPVETRWGYVIVRVLTEAEGARHQGLGPVSMGATGVDLDYEPVSDVSGLTEATNFFLSFPKPPAFQQDLKVNCETRVRVVLTAIQQLQDDLTISPPGSPDAQLTHYTLAQMLGYEGNMRKAVEQFQMAYDIGSSISVRGTQVELEEILAIAELRRGDVENCLHHHNEQSCIVPLVPNGFHKLTSGSENAAKHFLKHLEHHPEDLEAKWLLNLATMNLGRYPGGVPEKYLIPPAAVFESKEDIGQFEDLAPRLGLNLFNQSGSVIIDDFDNDGFLDLVVSTWDHCDSLRYFHNNGDGSFSDRTAEAGLADQLGGLNLIQTDYNNDGWTDILVLRGAWQTPMRKSLLRNNGDGTFTDVTREAGLAFPATSSNTAVWADFDNDGLLELFVGVEYAPCQLFHNNGDGTFRDVAHSAGVDRIAFTKAVTAGDYDNDGYPDIYVSNYGQANFLYHNNGDGTFTDVAPRMHVEKPIYSFPSWFFDYDNDGWLDIFSASFIHSVSEVVRSYLGLPFKTETPKLYKNNGGTSFRDVTAEVGLDRVFMPMGANFGDINNDGFLDIYLGTGDPSYASLVPNVLLLNKDGQHFVDITASSRTGCLQKGHGVAIADIFNDGRPCIYESIGGAMPGDRYFNALFRSPISSNNWVSIKLVGVRTNRAALGARIKLTVNSPGESPRFIYRDVNSGGSFGASPLQQHIGVGKATKIAILEISWPTSKTHQVFHDVRVNQFIEVHEFANDYVKLQRRSIKV
jgi:hypothetical protein